LVEDAKVLEAAGAGMVLFELIPSPLAKRVTEALTVPTIGIGAGPHATGQVLVLHDILDVTPGRRPRFAKNYMAGKHSIREAVSCFVAEVKSGEYPAPEHSFAN
jgi:3-methyl-2-oxobutanoate hydroxymethyltransferase